MPTYLRDEGTKESRTYLLHFDPVENIARGFNEIYPANTWSKLHSHAWGELAYTIDGCMVVCTEKGNWMAGQDKAIWIPPNREHEWYTPCRTQDCSLWIDYRALLSIKHFSSFQTLQISPLIREILLYLCRLPSGEGYVDSQRYAILFLLELLTNLPVVEEPLVMPQDKRLVELCTALLASPGEPFSINRWASRLGMSERNLSRLFKQETGSSFRDWRKLQKMRYARQLLRNGENTTSVSLECGYSSISAFIATFKQFFGITPGQLTRHDAE